MQKRLQSYPPIELVKTSRNQFHNLGKNEKRYQDAPAADIDWLNMRSMYFFAREDVSEAIFQEDLAAKVAEAYLVLEPIYRLFTRVIED